MVILTLQSVRLWRDYLDFVEENDKSVSQCSPSGLTKMRNLFERAITAGGLHVTDGSKLWEAYREYEMAILTIIDDDDEEKAKQVQRIRVLFHRQLSVPLVDMESILAEYKSWEAEQGNANDPTSNFDGVPSNVVAAYKKATEMYNVRKQYEDQLSNADASDGDKLEEFLVQKKTLLIIFYCFTLLLFKICHSFICLTCMDGVSLPACNVFGSVYLSISGVISSDLEDSYIFVASSLCYLLVYAILICFINIICKYASITRHSRKAW